MTIPELPEASTDGLISEAISGLDEGIVDSALFSSPLIFEAEMERIFHRWWVYVGHESEISQPGDYCLKHIGRQPVIMSRDEQGEINVLLNRCRHRASTVCQMPQGNSMVFRCQYHGWTYKNSGELIGVSRADGYGPDFDKSQMGLHRVPRMGNIRGFIFASLATAGISFEDYIGPAAPFIDSFCDASPVGEIFLGAGAQHTVFNGNWKYIGGDGYHGAFTHASVKELLDRRQGNGSSNEASAGAPSIKKVASTFLDRAASNAVSLGRGHGRLHDDKENDANITTMMREAHLDPDDGKRYEGLMREAYGDQWSLKIAQSDPHLEVWPNLQLTSIHVRTIRPVAPDQTQVDMAPALLKGVSEGINDARVRQHEWFFGPGSFGSPDDTEIFERVQSGFRATYDASVMLSRGLHRQEISEQGWKLGARSDETTQRGALSEWRIAMGVDDRG